MEKAPASPRARTFEDSLLAIIGSLAHASALPQPVLVAFEGAFPFFHLAGKT